MDQKSARVFSIVVFAAHIGAGPRSQRLWHPKARWEESSFLSDSQQPLFQTRCLLRHQPRPAPLARGPIYYLSFLSLSFTPLFPRIRICCTLATSPTLAALWILPISLSWMWYLGMWAPLALSRPKPTQLFRGRAEGPNGDGPLLLKPKIFFMARGYAPHRHLLRVWLRLPPQRSPSVYWRASQVSRSPSRKVAAWLGRVLKHDNRRAKLQTSNPRHLVPAHARTGPAQPVPGTHARSQAPPSALRGGQADAKLVL